MATKKTAKKRATRKVFLKIEDGNVTSMKGWGAVKAGRELAKKEGEAKLKASVPEYGEIEIWDAGRLKTRILTGPTMCIHNESGVGPCRLQGGKLI